MDVLVVQCDLERLGRVAFPLALGTGHVEIAEELHLDLLEAVPHAASAASVAAVEGEEARGDAARFSIGRFGEKLAHGLEEARVNDRGRARGAGEGRLVDHHDLAQMSGAADLLAAPDLRLAGGLAEGFEEISVKDGMDEGRLARSGNPRDTAEHAEGKFDIDLFQVVLGGALHREGAGRLATDHGHGDGFFSR